MIPTSLHLDYTELHDRTSWKAFCLHHLSRSTYLRYSKIYSFATFYSHAPRSVSVFDYHGGIEPLTIFHPQIRLVAGPAVFRLTVLLFLLVGCVCNHSASFQDWLPTVLANRVTIGISVYLFLLEPRNLSCSYKHHIYCSKIQPFQPIHHRTKNTFYAWKSFFAVS